MTSTLLYHALEATTPFTDVSVDERRRHSCCQALTIVCFNSATDAKLSVGIITEKDRRGPKRTEKDRKGPKRTEKDRKGGPRSTEKDRKGPKRT